MAPLYWSIPTPANAPQIGLLEREKLCGLDLLLYGCGFFPFLPLFFFVRLLSQKQDVFLLVPFKDLLFYSKIDPPFREPLSLPIWINPIHNDAGDPKSSGFM